MVCRDAQDVFVHIKDCTGGQPAPGDMHLGESEYGSQMGPCFRVAPFWGHDFDYFWGLRKSETGEVSL